MMAGRTARGAARSVDDVEQRAPLSLLREEESRCGLVGLPGPVWKEPTRGEKKGTRKRIVGWAVDKENFDLGRRRGEGNVFNNFLSL
jgi:hypothetical protein